MKHILKNKLFFLLLLSCSLYGNFLPIVFKGNNHVKESELYAAINLYKPFVYEFWKKEPKVNPQTAVLLAQTIKNYYRSQGYFHTVVTYSENNDYLEISIDEKSPINVADISIISALNINAIIPFKVGKIFDALDFEESKKDIKLLYANQGYCNTKLDAKAWIDLETNSAYLVYDVEQNELCYFGAITIEPAQNIDAPIIESLLYIEEAEVFSPYLINQSYKSLYGHEGISKAIIDTQVQDENRALVDVKVIRNEKPIRFQAGIGASSDEGLMVSLGVKHRNLFSNLKTLSLDTRVTQVKQTIKTNFDMPLANRNLMGAEIGYENEIFLGFKERRAFGTLYLKQREIVHAFKEGLFFDQSTTYDSDDDVLFVEGNLFVLSPQLQWVHDTRDNILDPTQGYLLSVELMGSILSEISDASYYKYKLSGAYILPLSPSVLALKVDVGSLHLIDGTVPASYHFYAGGMNSNRAYNYRQLGPVNSVGDPTGFNSILEMTAEYRFPIYGKIRGVLFNDTTFISEESYHSYQKGYYSIGAGLRYVTPIGPLAIDIGFDVEDPLKRYAIHFHIGELF